MRLFLPILVSTVSVSPLRDQGDAMERELGLPFHLDSATWSCGEGGTGSGGEVGTGRGRGGVLAEPLCVSILFYFPIYEMG